MEGFCVVDSDDHLVRLEVGLSGVFLIQVHTQIWQGELDFACAPINVRVMLDEPVMSQIDVGISQVHDCECNAFIMAIDCQLGDDEMRDNSLSVRTTIGVVDGNLNGGFMGRDLVFPD
jgi:hypothetical protein